MTRPQAGRGARTARRQFVSRSVLPRGMAGMRPHWLIGIALLGAVVLTGCAESRAFQGYNQEVDT